MAITSFYLSNMFPQMRTLHHHRTINTQHPSQTCSLRCALIHHHLTINTQHPSQTCSLRCALIHHHLTINTQHPDKTCSLRCALYHHHRTINTHHPTAISIIQQISPSNSLANSSSRSRWSSRIGEIPPMKSVTRFPSFVSTTTGNLPLKDML